MNKVTLVLGGGGAKSVAHLGVLQKFQDEGIEVNSVVACSGGSIIAALFANGLSPQQIKDELYRFTTRVGWLRVGFNIRGVFSQRVIERILENLGTDIDLQDTKIPIVLVATNLDKARLDVFDSGNMKNVVRASVAFPGLYPPVKVDDYLYVDGGVLNSVPADIARSKFKENIIVSVNLDNHLVSQNLQKLHAPQVVYRSAYIPLINERQRIATEHSDVVVEPFVHTEFNFKNWKDVLRFYSVREMESFYQLGMSEAEKSIGKIKSLMKA